VVKIDVIVYDIDGTKLEFSDITAILLKKSLSETLKISELINELYVEINIKRK